MKMMHRNNDVIWIKISRLCWNSSRFGSKLPKLPYSKIIITSAINIALGMSSKSLFKKKKKNITKIVTVQLRWYSKNIRKYPWRENCDRLHGNNWCNFSANNIPANWRSMPWRASSKKMEIKGKRESKTDKQKEW